MIWTVVLSVYPVCDIGLFGPTAGWIKMQLGTEVGLGPGDIVLDGNPAPPKKGHSICNRSGNSMATLRFSPATISSVLLSDLEFSRGSECAERCTAAATASSSSYCVKQANWTARVPTMLDHSE